MAPSQSNPRPLRVLVVDDEANIRVTLGLCLEAAGHEVTLCASAHEAIQIVSRQPFDVIFLDVRLGVSNGLDLIPRMLAESPWAKVVVITAYASAESAIIAMDRGAADYLPKPFTPAQVQLVVRKVVEQRKLELKLGALQTSDLLASAEEEPITTSSEMRQARDLAQRLASGDTTLLIRGEPGTGKEHLARAIHAWSPRAAGACAAVSCETVAANSLDAVLFGGPPAGAAGPAWQGSGTAALCDGGTLILKEIGAAPAAIQPKLVRLIREKEYERHDDLSARKSDVRVVATTSEDLQCAAARDRLRSDLLLAVNIVQIELPPLRQRAQDIQLLAVRFCAAAARKNHRAISGFKNDAMATLMAHPWPGNVRELRSVVEKAVMLCESGKIALEHLPSVMLCRDQNTAENLMPLEALEEMHIRRVLQSAKSLDAAAAILGIDTATLWRRRNFTGWSNAVAFSFAALSLRTKLWLGLGGLFFILLLGSAISAVVLTHFSRELQQLLRENYDSTVFCNEMTGALDRLDASARQLAWDEAGDPVDVSSQQRRFDENLTRELNNISLPGELEETQHLALQWWSYRQAYDRLTHVAWVDRRALYAQSLLPIYRQTRAGAQRIASLNMNNVVSADGRVRKTMIEVRNVLLALVGVGALLAVVVLWAAGATVLQPLGDLTRSARQIGAGELDLAVSVRSGDEVGQLSAAFNAMAQRLREYRKIDHERLQRAESTTQLAIDSLRDAVFVLSPDGLIQISNRTARTHFGAEPGKRVTELGLPWLAALHDSVARGAAAEPRGYASAVQLFDDGHERFLLPHGAPMFDAEGTLVGVTIVLADVTALRKADEFKSGLVSTVSHELRTPLTAMRMSTMLLADGTMGPLTSRQRKLVDAAKEESERLYRIIESLLEFSRAQAAAGKQPSKPVPVKQMVAGALAPLSDGFAEKGVTLHISVDGAPDLMADASCAVSVLSNLLSNALKFTPANGAVSVHAESCGSHVAVMVSDTGPGVPPEYAQRIFERFFRVPGREATPGSGLGLAIAQQLVEAHGGSLSYAPRPGGGSLFRFTLPAVEGSGRSSV